jgi:CBS domain-containing protein
MRVTHRTPTPPARVRDVMTTGVVATHRNESLADIAIRMRDHGVGAVAIMEGEALIGIITERDLSRATADGLSPRVTRADAYMTSEPFTIDAGEEVSEAASTMAARGIRHLPVTDEGRVIGVVSARDLLLSSEPCRELAELAYEPW